jgi:hypothetical protein
MPPWGGRSVCVVCLSSSGVGRPLKTAIWPASDTAKIKKLQNHHISGGCPPIGIDPGWARDLPEAEVIRLVYKFLQRPSSIYEAFRLRAWSRTLWKPLRNAETGRSGYEGANVLGRS